MNTTKYLQTDSRWSGLGYPKSPCTIGNSGCGEVSVCNVIIEMERYKGYTPKTIQPYCKQYAEPRCNGTYHSGIPAMMKNYGLTEVKEHATMDSLWNELAKGNRVAIYLMGSRLAGTNKVRWTSSGHFVASTGYKYKDSDHWVYMKDSNSHSSKRNGWISYKGNIRGDCLKVWSGKLTGDLYGCSEAVKGAYTSSGKLTVDGNGGKATVKRMQEFFGTKQDGVITGQKKSNSKYYSALHSVKYGSGGSSCIKKLQKWVGTSQDGVLGEKTVKAWQKKIGVSADGHFGKNSMKVWQKYLNEHDKPVYPTPTPTPTPTPSKTVYQKICDWARKIASDNSYHYVKWSSNKKTHECPICHNHPKGKYHGWNCIGFAFASWKHGGGIKCKCNCSVINDDEWKKLYNAKTDADALKLAKKLIGINDIKLMRSKSNLAQSKLQAGDICCRFDGSNPKHIWLYLGNGMMADCRGSNGKVPNNDQISVRKAQSCKIAIRYTGK